MFDVVGLSIFGALIPCVFLALLGLIRERFCRRLGLAGLLGCIALGGAIFACTSSLSPSPEALFVEAFGERSECVTELKAVRVGGAGDYKAFLQFRATPEVQKHLRARLGLSGSFGGTAKAPLVWCDGEKIPAWWLSPKEKGFDDFPILHSLTGHFGIRFHPDGATLRSFPKSGLMQLHWRFYD
jgi:hypothetical protein